MSRRCELTGKKANNACSVSHSNRHTNRLQHVNLQNKRVWWEGGKRWVRLKLSTKAIKTLQHKGLEAMAKEAGKYLSKINLTFLEKRKISVFLICSLFPVPCSLSKI
ncbi:50S ribosomal protein L28 [Cuspidothrix issatschenkoi LEGE 03284]|nr:50S ribosomal protein L28 [Cuspidothrix issatschenkoi LEGE 03284]